MLLSLLHHVLGCLFLAYSFCEGCLDIYVHCLTKAHFTPSGSIPLRHLVYRVIDLPPSMRPFVYDFGLLNAEREKEYIMQAVLHHVRYMYT